MPLRDLHYEISKPLRTLQYDILKSHGAVAEIQVFLNVRPCFEHNSARIHRNVSNYLPIDMTGHPNRPKPSTVHLWHSRDADRQQVIYSRAIHTELGRVPIIDSNTNMRSMSHDHLADGNSRLTIGRATGLMPLEVGMWRGGGEEGEIDICKSVIPQGKGILTWLWEVPWLTDPLRRRVGFGTGYYTVSVDILRGLSNHSVAT